MYIPFSPLFGCDTAHLWRKGWKIVSQTKSEVVNGIVGRCWADASILHARSKWLVHDSIYYGVRFDRCSNPKYQMP